MPWPNHLFIIVLKQITELFFLGQGKDKTKNRRMIKKNLNRNLPCLDRERCMQASIALPTIQSP
ncbi:MAG: hypothetical protein CMQ39_05420 [Gammaproteobacteria bacterium]|nr:hypothetical protein [Gammaproteobacteria bacterium]